MSPILTRTAVLLATAAVAVGVTVVPAQAAPVHDGMDSASQRAGQTRTSQTRGRVPVWYVVDGDTIRLADGRYVRLIGIDTPERGRPYYRVAKDNLDRLVGKRVRLVNPTSVDDRDRYGRLLRYLRVGHHHRDAGLAQIRKGFAHARYDGRDGYDRHPLQATYRRTDAHTRDRW